MKKNQVNPPGKWDFWNAEKKRSLELAGQNTQVGEKLVFENHAVKVWSIHLPAGQALPFHKHLNPYFWTILVSGKSRSFYQDGSVVDTEYETGDTLFFENLGEKDYFIHNLENIGDTTLIFTTVEFLIPLK